MVPLYQKAFPWNVAVILEEEEQAPNVSEMCVCAVLGLTNMLRKGGLFQRFVKTFTSSSGMSNCTVVRLQD